MQTSLTLKMEFTRRLNPKEQNQIRLRLKNFKSHITDTHCAKLPCNTAAGIVSNN